MELLAVQTLSGLDPTAGAGEEPTVPFTERVDQKEKKKKEEEEEEEEKNT